jgi:hypothetical protein
MTKANRDRLYGVSLCAQSATVPACSPLMPCLGQASGSAKKAIPMMNKKPLIQKTRGDYMAGIQFYC